MSEGRIRFRAAAVFLIKNHILVHEVSNRDDGRKWFIPPGGGIHHGETSRAALVREIREELGWEIDDIESLGAFESLHSINGNEEHEVSFVYRATVPRSEAGLDLASGIREADETGKIFRWVALPRLNQPTSLLYPHGLLDKIGRNDDVSLSNT